MTDAHATPDAPQAPTPEEALGYQMGTARKLPDWHEIVDYYDKLAAASDRVQVERLGESTNGLPYLAVFVSAPENLARREELRGVLGRLYDPRGLDAAEEAALVERGTVTACCSAPSTPTRSARRVMTLELASDLATPATTPTHAKSSTTSSCCIVPSLNPDGHRMIVEWYRAAGSSTPYEGQPMPLALPPLRRPRQQPRLVHADAGRDAP